MSRSVCLKILASLFLSDPVSNSLCLGRLVIDFLKKVSLNILLKRGILQGFLAYDELIRIFETEEVLHPLSCIATLMDVDLLRQVASQNKYGSSYALRASKRGLYLPISGAPLPA